MTAITTPPTQINYPSSDGEPVAETYDHFYVLLCTLEVLRQYLKGQQATVLGNQFLYYAQGFPKLRVAPDVMVIFDVEPGGRDNYKLWEEGQVPRVIFEMTSRGTKDQDVGFKKGLYEQLEVQEYWLFDPKGEWLEGQLQGYRLQGETYVPISDRRSHALQLRLEIEDKLIAFYREDTGEKLLLPDELAANLQTETQRRLEAEQQAEQESQRAEQESQRAEQERQRAEQERQRADDLATMLERYQSQFGELPE
ncbi:Uma2 family endonuclease [Kovacikia minuta CCNUW1]|uniref:Uma2 family endonuclease n=1 Tax=Kovacikia minuta TaxID=2931930 RepID=UPI001CCB5A76|nr:Uma2 family endonuclease [Kovacikia minuta]UBF25588.1 Uma2 family endonuclease [Kovacikia minuta CCNUW1]